MPKLKRNPTEEMRFKTRAALDHYITYKGMSNKEVAKRACISEVSFYKKRQRPETFTLGELWDLAKILGCPVEHLTKGIL